MAAVACALLVVALISAGRGGEASSWQHASGITILTGGSPRTALSEEAKRGLQPARALSDAHPTHFTYAHVDPGTGQVRLTAVDDEGVRLARQAGVSAQASPGTRSRAELERVMDAVIGPQPEGVVVLTASPDTAAGRIDLEVDRLDDAFLHRVAAAHGADAVAVRVSPRPEGGGSPA